MQLIFAVLTIFFIPGLSLIIFSALNIIVAKDPRITDLPYKATFEVSGTLAKKGNRLTIETRRGAGGWEMLIDGGPEVILLDNQGRLRGTDAFTPFWIYMKNPVVNTVQRATKNYEAPIIDSLNLFGGGLGARYIIRMTDSFILWSAILESQASYHMGIFDESGVEMATAVIDGTCGFLFQIETHRNGAGRLDLLDTDFPISRNRYFQVKVGSIVAVLLAAIFLFRYFKAPEDKKAVRRWELKFALWGIIACFVDIYPDVWWPFAFGSWGLLALHAVPIIIGAIWFGWWTLPGIIEILWAATFAIQTGTMIPQLTHSPGLMLSWMMAALFFRIPKKITGDKLQATG